MRRYWLLAAKGAVLRRYFRCGKGDGSGENATKQTNLRARAGRFGDFFKQLFLVTRDDLGEEKKFI